MIRPLAFAALIALVGQPAAAATIIGAHLQVRMLAEPFPPLQYADADGTPRGAVYTLVRTALDRLSNRLPIEVAPLEFVPLKRALLIAATEPNVMVLSVARTPERENQYRWLNVVSSYDLWLYRYKRHTLPPLTDVQSLRGKQLRFGVQDGSNFHEWLKRQGFSTPPDNSIIDTVPQNGLNFMKAQVGRIDLFAHPDISFAFRASEHQQRASDFEKVMRIDELSTPLWAVTGPHSDARLVALLQDSLQKLQQSGQAERIRQDSLKEFSATYKLDTP